MEAAPARPSPARLYGLLALLVALWAANFVFGKIAVRGAPPFLVVCLRTVLSGAFMVPVWLAVGRRRGGPELQPLTARVVPRLMLLGVLGIVGNQMLFVLALGHTSVAHAAIVGATSPLLVLAFAVLLGQERLTARKVLGLAAAAAGVALIQVARTPGGEGGLVGDLLMIGNAALFAGFSVLGKDAASTYGSLVLNALAFWGGAVLALPFAVVGLVQLGGPGQIGAAAWGSILYMAVAPSIVGYVIYSYALRWLSASRVSAVTYLQPVGATALSVAFLGERPGLAYLGGAAVVLLGVWVAQRR